MRKHAYWGIALVVTFSLILTVLAQGPVRGNGQTQGQQGTMNCQGDGAQMRHGGMRGQGAGQGFCQHVGQGFNPADRLMVSGQVTAVNVEQGKRFPNVTVSVEGKPLTVVVGPYWALAQAEFQIKVGDMLTIAGYASKTTQNTLIAAEIKNAEGKMVILRDQNGIPVRVPGNGTCPHDGSCPQGASCPNPNCPCK